MNVLLTGAHGNLGKSLQKLTAKKIIPVGKSDWQQIDDLMKQDVQVVIHAGCDLKNKINENPHEVIDSNIQKTAFLLEKMKEHNIKRIVFTSSCAVYGDTAETNEESLCSPVSFNGMSKRLNEKVIEDYCNKQNIKYDILRIFNTYGGDDKFSILYLLKKAIREKNPFYLNNEGISQRDFVHVDDVAEIINKLLDMENPYPILNIGTGRTFKISDIISYAKEKYPDLEVRSSTANEIEYSRGNITKLKKLINYQFKDILTYIKENF